MDSAEQREWFFLENLGLRVTLILLSGITALIVDYSRMLYLRKKMPPGPLPWPIAGNTLSLPKERPWYMVEQLSKDYKSPVITFWIGRRHMLMFGELMNEQDNLIHKYTYTNEQRERFRVLRKITHHGVGTQQVQQYREFQDDKNMVLAYDILKTPELFASRFERYAAGVVSIVGLGRRISNSQDTLITEVIAQMQHAAQLAVVAKDWLRIIETFPYENYAKFLFREAPQYNLSRGEVSSLVSNLFGAGADTSSSTLITAVIAMRAFPETMKPAWDELDRVAGHSRSPTLDDELPYVRAFAKVFRWRAVANLGGKTHAPTQDDYWNCYFIPKGTWIQGNVWAIHHNEREFPDPDRFNPRRRLDTEDLRPFPGEKGYMTFGWGGGVVLVRRLLSRARISVLRACFGPITLSLLSTRKQEVRYQLISSAILTDQIDVLSLSRSSSLLEARRLRKPFFVKGRKH
ncbi:cytochrome P450 [Bipolaris maydis]|uniref:cytochrome P450 n=1 Tax=Cochliobolus heterostrophus TaxID=5016 RepID=UPI0024DA86E5|nr:cytochrome P450 [Bipolaris maydis]KAJ6282303.1 cytochrome P450 [Bipolaris maydis]